MKQYKQMNMIEHYTVMLHLHVIIMLRNRKNAGFYNFPNR